MEGFPMSDAVWGGLRGGPAGSYPANTHVYWARSEVDYNAESTDIYDSLTWWLVTTKARVSRWLKRA